MSVTQPHPWATVGKPRLEAGGESRTVPRPPWSPSPAKALPRRPAEAAWSVLPAGPSALPSASTAPAHGQRRPEAGGSQAGRSRPRRNGPQASDPAGETWICPPGRPLLDSRGWHRPRAQASGTAVTLGPGSSILWAFQSDWQAAARGLFGPGVCGGYSHCAYGETEAERRDTCLEPPSRVCRPEVRRLLRGAWPTVEGSDALPGLAQPLPRLSSEPTCSTRQDGWPHFPDEEVGSEQGTVVQGHAGHGLGP